MMKIQTLAIAAALLTSTVAVAAHAEGVGSMGSSTAASTNLKTGSAAGARLKTNSAAQSRMADPRAASGNVGASLRGHTDADTRAGATTRDTVLDNTTANGSNVRAGLNTDVKAGVGSSRGSGAGLGLGVDTGVGINTR